MSMRTQQIKEITNFPTNEFEMGKWYDLVFFDADTPEKRIFQIRRISLNSKLIEKMNPLSVTANLLSYFREIQMDADSIQNSICTKGCSSCCTNDFPISVVEFFTILRYIGISYPEDFILQTEKKAKLSISAPKCIFVDETDNSCKIYEVRPLICRKYGTYADTDCYNLKGVSLRSNNIDTSGNTICFDCKQYGGKRFMCSPENMVYWFGKLQNRTFQTQRMHDLYDAAYFSDIDTFVKVFLM